MCRPEAAHAVWPSEKPYCAELRCAEAALSDGLSFFQTPQSRRYTETACVACATHPTSMAEAV
ncbi:hypothetical protein HMPREF9123_2057 [Neisseria bacilliformis ATCC BAA-1200]|uniref:Uncharacterized protein n=1 Tax=Neisseria bacilliformis ATCC BAA-1200 TaxID=888742 RepID=F2BEA1_9NEIS|nr:hypothetical protein HMPREF9123_2057 [Neisseria bacilliformis ATCC BAA-1200]